MDAKREDEGTEEEEEGDSVAVLVEAGALAELEDVGTEESMLIDGGDMEDGEAPVARTSRWEYKSEEDRATDSVSADVGHAGPPPPPPMRLYGPTLLEFYDQPQEHQHLPTLPPEPVAESKRDVDDGDEAPTTRSDEWTSTRRSGRRSQQAPRAAPGRASVGSKYEKDEARVGSWQHPGRQTVEEDKPLVYFPDEEEDLTGAPGLIVQSEAAAEADTEGGLKEEDVAVVIESSAAPSRGPAADESLESEEKSDELAESHQHITATEAPSIGLYTAETTDSAADPDVAHPDGAISYPSTVHASPRAEEFAAAVSPPSSLTAPTVIAPSIRDESSMLPEASATASLARSGYSEEQEWVPCVSDSGHTYYYNRFTQECRWQRPQTPELSQGAFDAVMAADGAKRLERKLLDGLDPDAANKDGVTLLHMAAQTGNERAVELLVAYGAVVDSTTAYATTSPLLSACQHGHSSIAKTLLECGASPVRADGSGNSVLHLAVYSRNNDVLRVVLEVTDDGLVNQQNAEGETALHIATKLDNSEAVQALLAQGANPQIEDAQGQSPLIVGILENSVECMQLLQNVQPSPGTVSDVQGRHAPLAQAADPYAGTGDSENNVDKLLASIVPTPESCDHEVLEALRSFADETQCAISTLEDQLQVSPRCS